MKILHTFTFLFLLALPAYGTDPVPPAPPTLTLPSVVKGESGDFVVIKSDTNCVSVKWLALDPGLKLFPADELANKTHAIVTARVDGSYRLLAYAAGLGVDGKPMATDPVVCTVIIGTPGPPPPPPPPPPPNDPFIATLQTAYAADSDADKAKSVAFLAAVYKATASMINDASFKTPSDVMAAIKAAENVPSIGLAKTAIPKTRAAIGAELNSRLPTNFAAPLDAAARMLIGKEFNRMADALGGLK